MQAVPVKAELWILGFTHDHPYRILFINFNMKYSLIFTRARKRAG